MGTNYYAVKNRASIESPIHIGKSSCGWLFNFQTQNDTWRDIPVVWNTYPQVKEWLETYVVKNKEYVILDEYDREISYEEFIELVETKQKDPHNLKNPDNFTWSKNIDGYRFSDSDFS